MDTMIEIGSPKGETAKFLFWSLLPKFAYGKSCCKTFMEHSSTV